MVLELSGKLTQDDRELAGNLLDSATPLEGWDASRTSVVRGDRDGHGELDAPGPLNKQTKLAMLGGNPCLLLQFRRFQMHKYRNILGLCRLGCSRSSVHSQNESLDSPWDIGNRSRPVSVLPYDRHFD